MSFSPRCLVVSCMCVHLPRSSLPTSSFVALTSVANTLALFVSAHGGHVIQAFFKIVRNFFVLRRGCSQKLQWKNSQRMWFHWPKHAFSTSPNVPWLHCAKGAVHQQSHIWKICVTGTEEWLQLAKHLIYDAQLRFWWSSVGWKLESCFRALRNPKAATTLLMWFCPVWFGFGLAWFGFLLLPLLAY